MSFGDVKIIREILKENEFSWSGFFKTFILILSVLIFYIITFERSLFVLLNRFGDTKEVVDALKINLETNFQIPILLAKHIIFIIICVLVIIPCYLVVMWFINSRSFNKGFKLNNKKLLNKWLFSGNLILEESSSPCFYLFTSNLGCIIKNRSWKDYEMSFNFKLSENDKYEGFGIILRAKDLENYFMLKIDHISPSTGLTDENKTYLKPHIMKSGFWEVLGDIKAKSWKLEAGKEYHAKISLERCQVFLEIDKMKICEYLLPTHTTAILEKTKNEDKDKETNSGIASLISFRKVGSVGFRAYGHGGVFIKNFKVEKINIWTKIVRKFSQAF